jgi:hypothetical protein
MRSFNPRTIAYWATTAVVALALAGGAIAQLSGAPEPTATLQHLGYPAYVATLIGFWKGLGLVALLVPRFERLKEWAYAGMFFNFSGAAVSHVASGDALGQVLPPLVILGFVLASWALRPASRRLAAPRAGFASEKLPATHAFASQ